MRLQGKVCLITGASRGIGKAIALTFAREGANVIVNDILPSEKVVNEIIEMRRKAISAQGDVSNRDEVFKIVEQAIKEFGKIDILVNNAGIPGRVPNILECSKELWEKVLGVNLLGAYYFVQAIAPYMIKQRYGKIINISSSTSFGQVFHGTRGKESDIAYNSSKSALNTLTKYLAYDLGQYNINVNAICPGLTMTEIQRVGRTEEETKLFQSSVRERVAEYTALRRAAEPQDIANAALFLASDESRHVTGQIILVDAQRSDMLSHGG